MSSHRFLWLAVIGFLIYFGIRIHHLDVVPLFIDESINVERSVNIVNGTFLEHARTGKFLLPYITIPFQPHINAVWAVRLGTLLLTCLGVASAIAISKRYAERTGGLLTLLLMSFSPMLFLFDRFALSDTLLHVTITIWILSLFMVFDRRKLHIPYVLMSGILFVISMFAKSPTLFLAPLPLVFASLLPRWTILDRMKAVVAFYGITFILWIPFTILLTTRKIDYFGKAGHVAPSVESLLDFERIINNLSFMISGIVTYHGIPIVVVATAVILIAIPFRMKVILSLGAGIVGYGIAIVLLGGFGLFIRYYTPIVPLLLITFSIAVVKLVQVIYKLSGKNLLPLVFGLVIVWIGLFSLPFIHMMYTDPHNAPLVGKDRSEYMRANSSGFAIPELRDYLINLAESEPIVVEGAIVSCYTLDLYTPDHANITIQCPNVLSGDRRAPYLNQYLPEEADKHASYYVVFETEGIVDYEDITEISLTPVTEFPRPGNGVIQLFKAG